MNLKEQFDEINRHLIVEEQPSIYLEQLRISGALALYPFSMLAALWDTPQSPIHHPEGNAWRHTCMVVDQAAKARAKSNEAQAFLWAALLHDIGKPDTTRVQNGKIISYDHDKVGMRLAEKFMSAFTEDKALTHHVTTLVRYHMQPFFVLKHLPFARMEDMKRETDVREVALLSYCDRMGRGGASEWEERAAMQRFLQKCGEAAPDRAYRCIRS